ncbi:uncharacterized protein LOC123556523 [Mercenaria mercenaria]|uniref:uncharacterized protein LOC123556523 n=1 Tax=Mercenaria mercenaria TaxID=6596 RepID=UPI00234F2BB9|nr:uncharacterized protein LOC123556523 [Mercenaria mercenaria]
MPPPTCRGSTNHRTAGQRTTSVYVSYKITGQTAQSVKRSSRQATSIPSLSKLHTPAVNEHITTLPPACLLQHAGDQQITEQQGRGQQVYMCHIKLLDKLHRA